MMSENLIRWECSPLSGWAPRSRGGWTELPGGAPSGGWLRGVPGLPSGEHPCAKRLMKLLRILAAQKRRRKGRRRK
jgi:hypothetical protein